MRFLAVLPMFTLMACGVGNGKLLKDMDEGDWKSYCASEVRDEKTVMCTVLGTEVEVTVGGTADDCEAANAGNEGSLPDTCEATVGDLRDCNDAIYDDPCSLMGETAAASCEVYFSCLGT
jgi:hypothetical protein